LRTNAVCVLLASRTTDHVQLVDARRLTGKNILGERPLVIVELALDAGETVPAARTAYGVELARMRTALGLTGEVSLVTRPHHGGVVFGYAAPMDTMLAHAEASEWAAESAVKISSGHAASELEPKRLEIAAMLAKLENPRFARLEDACRAKGIPFLWDDEAISLGEGRTSHTYPLGSLPGPEDVAWNELSSIPTLMVTGTNGKTTSARLVAFMARQAGFVVGLTSSDGALVNDEVLASGDFTGPAAARLVLRDTRVDVAVLETARGGILRRGLAIDDCDVALLTNISADHLGGYGIDDLAAMTEVKTVCARAATKAVVLNALDPSLLALVPILPVPVILFADLEAHPEGARLLTAHAETCRKSGHEATTVFTQNGQFVLSRGDEETRVPVREVPITFGGAARYNVENALGAIGAAVALGLPEAAWLSGLRAFGPRDNPGRGDVVEMGGTRFVLDYAHNPEGAEALASLLAGLKLHEEGRLTVVAGSPGDRSDADIVAFAESIVAMKPDKVLVRELPNYLRGRALGDVPALFRRVVEGAGIAFGLVQDEADAIDRCVQDARPGDLVAIFPHVDREEVAARLAKGK
jgi:cyanophycin synthetase